MACSRVSSLGILAPRCHPQILERHGIEVVVGERNEPEPTLPQLHDLVEHLIHVPRARTLSICPPDRAERAVLRTPADRLHRAPHIAPGRQQIPAAGEEGLAFNPTAVVLDARGACLAIAQGFGPGTFTVARHDSVRATELARLVWKERRMDAAVYDIRACRTCRGADLVAAERVAGMDADADDVARRDGRGVEAFERLVDQPGRAE